jgi:hypothetical protein
MPDAIVSVDGYTVTISGTVSPNQTVNVLFQKAGQADISRSATADASGNISGNQTLPASGIWDVTIFLQPLAESFEVSVPGGLADGPGVAALSTGPGQPKKFKLSVGSVITDKVKVNALRQKANLPPIP